ncbi:hypothetical protein [Bacillus sp. SD088]|uniref:hypothetical protein n=1 Tax=Bacillus sp. SD088 TaxID=2782012 RepID=UPI001A97AFD2|nr:hypothetical protein [Bacillus sp. SD088]MBO0995924.1 hypothetical protein [Bacillus sp. SD088]
MSFDLEKYLEEQRRHMDAINRMLEPSKAILDFSAKQMKIADGITKQYGYPEVLSQMEAIAKSVNKINVQVPSFENILGTYNQTRDFVQNYESYIDESDTDKVKAIEEAKEQFGEMPDLEPVVQKFSPEQMEQFKQVMTEINQEASKGKEAKKTLPERANTFLTLFVGISQVPEAIEKYYSAVKVICSIMKDLL